MRFHSMPRSLLQIITAILLTPIATSAVPPRQAEVPFAQLFERQACNGQLCGWNSQLCCSAGSACYTDASSQAQCSSIGLVGSSQQTTAAAGGYWAYYTTTYVATDLVTVTSVMSSYIASAAVTTMYPAAATTAECKYALNESPCGSICCASNQYCYKSGQCSAAANGDSSGYYSSYYTTNTAGAGAPLRPTSSTLVLITQTASPTTTVPFETPVATGANVTLASGQAQTGGGLSGGAIAGIVIGVLLGLLLLGLICFYLVVRGIWGTFFGRRKRRTTEIEEYERHSHHHSGGAAAGRRTWFGASRPARVERKDERRHDGRNLLGLGAGLAGLWAILGLKRREKRKNEDKFTEYSYASDYYTSASSASSDDRRTRDTRRSMSRR